MEEDRLLKRIEEIQELAEQIKDKPIFRNIEIKKVTKENCPELREICEKLGL